MDDKVRAQAPHGDFREKRFGVKVERDVKYGVGGVGLRSPQGLRYRDLKLDVYAPEGATGAPRPALVLSFGGAFHRGSKETDEFGDAEGMSTPMAEYARLFAERGYICFCIDYRLTQEDCDGGVTPTLDPDEPMNTDRINVVRDMLGLPPATDDELSRGIEAATDDLVKAVTFVRSRSRAYNVDIARIAVGGFSAGGISSLIAAFAECVPVKAVVAFSGRLSDNILRDCVTGAADEPTVLMFFGERDLPATADAAAPTEAHMKRVGTRHKILRLAGATHFYPRTTMTPEGVDVETTLVEFLREALGLA